MSTATIEVSHTYQPKQGKKKATVKTAAGELFGIWPEKLASIEPGKTYNIEFEQSEFNGRAYRTITRFELAPVTATADAKAKTASHSEMDFIAHLVAAGLASQQVEYHSEAMMKAAIMARGVYRELLRQST